MNLTLTINADSPQELANIMASLGNNPLPAVIAPKKEKPAAQAAPTITDAPAPAADKKTLGIEDVRAVIAAENKREEAKKLLSKFNATKLTELAPADYASFIEQLKAL